MENLSKDTFIYEDVVYDRILLSKIVKSINNYSNSIPHHSLQNLGDKIKNIECKNIPFYKISLNSLLDRRKYFNGYRPRYGEMNSPLFKVYNQNDVWGKQTKLLEKYLIIDFLTEVNESEKYEWNQGYKITNCPNCRGLGKTRCDICNGQGTIPCSICNSGGVVSCHSCGGRGHERYTEFINGRTIERSRLCYQCNGSGRLQCSYCRGKGRNLCSCDNGYRTCFECRGVGELTYFQAFENIIKSETIEEFAIHTDLLNDKKGSKLIDKLKTTNLRNVFEKIDDVIDVSDLNKISRKDIIDQISILINKSKNFSQYGLLNTDYKVVKQKLTIQRTDVYWVNYEFENEKYDILLYGESLEHYSISSPIDKQAKILLNEGEMLLNDKKYIEAYTQISKVIEMKSIHNSKAVDVKEMVSTKLRSHYYIGAGFGSIIFSLIILTYCLNPLKNLYVDNTNNYLVLSALILFILGTGFFLALFLSKKYLLLFRNNLLRIGIPFVFILFVNSFLFIPINSNFEIREAEKQINYDNYNMGVAATEMDSIQSAIHYFSDIDNQDTIFINAKDYYNYLRAIQSFESKDLQTSKILLSSVNKNSIINNKVDSLRKEIEEKEVEEAQKNKKIKPQKKKEKSKE